MRRWLARSHRSYSTSDALPLDRDARVARMRELAEEHGLRRLGCLVEELPSGRCQVDVWTDDAGVELHLTDLFYLLNTHLDDGHCVLTWSLRDPHTRSWRRLTSRSTAGSFGADLAAHRAAVAARGGSPRLHPTLDDQAEMTERYMREHVPLAMAFASIVQGRLVGWLGALTLVALAHAPLAPVVALPIAAVLGLAWLLLPEYHPNPASQARVRSRARAGGHPDTRSLIRAELDENLARRAPNPASAVRCPFCHDACAVGLRCLRCAALHHGECWSSHGRCATCGHPEARAGSAPSQAALGGVQ